jgi:hypothetical protein
MVGPPLVCTSVAIDTPETPYQPGRLHGRGRESSVRDAESPGHGSGERTCPLCLRLCKVLRQLPRRRGQHHRVGLGSDWQQEEDRSAGVFEIEAKANSQGRKLGAGDIYDIIYNVARAALNEAADKSSEEWKKGNLEKLAEFLKLGGKSLFKLVDISGKLSNAGAAGSRAYALARPQSLTEYFLVAVGEPKRDAGMPTSPAMRPGQTEKPMSRRPSRTASAVRTCARLGTRTTRPSGIPAARSTAAPTCSERRGRAAIDGSNRHVGGASLLESRCMPIDTRQLVLAERFPPRPIRRSACSSVHSRTAHAHVVAQSLLPGPPLRR